MVTVRLPHPRPVLGGISLQELDYFGRLPGRLFRTHGPQGARGGMVLLFGHIGVSLSLQIGGIDLFVGVVFGQGEPGVVGVGVGVVVGAIGGKVRAGGIGRPVGVKGRAGRLVGANVRAGRLIGANVRAGRLFVVTVRAGVPPVVAFALVATVPNGLAGPVLVRRYGIRLPGPIPGLATIRIFLIVLYFIRETCFLLHVLYRVP